MPAKLGNTKRGVWANLKVQEERIYKNKVVRREGNLERFAAVFPSLNHVLRNFCTLSTFQSDASTNFDPGMFQSGAEPTVAPTYAETAVIQPEISKKQARTFGCEVLVRPPLAETGANSIIVGQYAKPRAKNSEDSRVWQ